MNRSSRLLLHLFLLFAKVYLIREAVVVLEKKCAADCFRNQYKPESLSDLGFCDWISEAISSWDFSFLTAWQNSCQVQRNNE